MYFYIVYLNGKRYLHTNINLHKFYLLALHYMLTATVHDINLHHLTQQKKVGFIIFPIINDIKSD